MKRVAAVPQVEENYLGRTGLANLNEGWKVPSKA